jgi:hypothetical protein
LSTLIVGVLALAAYNGNSQEAFAAILGPGPTADATKAPPPDIAAMVRHVQSTKPDAVFASVSIDHIGKAGQAISLSMRSPGHLANGNTYYFKGDGTPLGDGGLEEGGIGQQILGVLQPLHFGWFGGYPVKFAYAILGLALTLVTYTGVTIWLARRRDKGRPAPRWERVWSGVGWGQPLALATSAIAALYASEAAILTVYLATTVIALAAAMAMPNARAAVLSLRSASAAALIALSICHFVQWHGREGDMLASAVNATIAVIAVIIAIPALALLLRRPKSAPSPA